jgi:hypothetical protein
MAPPAPKSRSPLERTRSGSRVPDARTGFGTVQRYVACGGATRVAHCRLTVALSLTETSAGHEPMALSASRSKRPTRSKKVVTVGQTSAVIAAGPTEVIRVHLNARGRRLLSTRGKLRVALIVTQATVAARHVVSRQTLTLTASPSNHRKKP